VTETTSKPELRKQALGRRAALDDTRRVQASHDAVMHLATLVRSGETVSLFYPIRGEIDPIALSGAVIAAGGTVLLPAVVDNQIEFRVHDLNTPLEHGAFGTQHPPAAAGARDPDLIVAPLAAFDRQGNRIGYGGGFYDRATARLAAAGHAFRYVGIAFACQEVEAVPAETHDRPLDAVVTENGLTAFTEQT
jgi:5-formyltetrahydrofolate cyclo-ligase